MTESCLLDAGKKVDIKQIEKDYAKFGMTISEKCGNSILSLDYFLLNMTFEQRFIQRIKVIASSHALTFYNYDKERFICSNCNEYNHLDIKCIMNAFKKYN